MMLQPEIKVGDILTSFSIIISALGLIYILSKDRSLRQKERADKIRNAASETLAKLDRWRELSLSLFQSVQPLFIDTIENLSIKFDIDKARNNLWKEMIITNNQIEDEILKEDLQTAYVNLMGYSPNIRLSFEIYLKKLQIAREKMFYDFIDQTQKNVLSFKGKEKTYKTEDLWNELIETTRGIKRDYEDGIRPIFDQISSQLLEQMSENDFELSDKAKAFDYKEK